jgi:hypothetical protein
MLAKATRRCSPPLIEPTLEHLDDAVTLIPAAVPFHAFGEHRLFGQPLVAPLSARDGRGDVGMASHGGVPIGQPLFDDLPR